ncbi:MAG: oxidoreductase [Gammaproteobacteria bacterium]|nr:oxidoreductase [Gammaproteobacteria bacterium]MBU1441631.1 oxidoreductase [Gammaproteobacteria bacterium]MBU2287525.1 oxidoreductase [Gammaproteobacteria bacterium]
MTSFKALRLHAGDPEPERRIESLTLDDLGPGDVTIEVAYSSINYKDALASRGRNQIVRQYPRIGGIDLTGTVMTSSDARFSAGDEVVVHGFGIGVDHDGGHAQVARVPADWVLPLPRGISLFEGAVLGAAGYTAALSLHWMELNGLAPDRGPVLVNGATGGVASIAIDMFTQRGYRVTAMTGKTDAHDELKALGAAEVIGRRSADASSKPLEKGLWAGAVDSVGGAGLAWLTRTMLPDGVIAAFGNAGGAELATTVLPFILRGVRLIGINANSPMPLRREVWPKIAGDYRPAHLDRIAHVITLEQLPEHLDRMLEGRLRGRTVIRMKG